MALFDRVRSLFTPLTAPAMEITPSSADAPVDTSSMPRPARDIDPNDLRGGGARGGGFYQAANALINMATGQGTSRDPTNENVWATPRRITQIERFGMGRNALIQQALGKLPNTATREGWRVEITDPAVDDKQEVSDKISAYEERLGLGQRINRALFRGRQHSQGMVILGIDDGQTFDKPVDVDNIQTILWAVTIDSRDFYPAKLAAATSEHYGGIEQFQITDINGILEDGLRYGENSISFTGAEWTAIFEEQRKQQGGQQLLVHADRVLFFPTPDYFSLLDSLQDSLGAYFEAMGGLRTAARESSIVKYSIGKLKQQMWSANSGLAREHMGLVQKAKSAINAFVVGPDEDVELLSRPLSGLDKIINPIMAWVAASISTPNTILWQVSPGGFGKGESERETYHEDVHAYQDQVLTPALTRAHGYMLAAKDGAQLPATTQREIVYNDLTPPDEEQRSKLRSEALSDLRQLAKDGLITRPEVRSAIEALSDDFFRLEIDTEFVDKPSPAQVGIFTGSIALLSAIGEGLIPPAAGRALLLALDPVHFNATNIPNIIALEDSPTSSDNTATGEPLASLPTDPNAPIIPGDEEDGEAEPSEVEIVWSEVAPPAGAKTARELADDPDLGASSRNIKQLAREGKLTAYKNRGFKTEPLFELEEVKRALLERQGQLQAPDPEAVTDVGPRALFVAFRLPPALAQWVPYKEHDTSPPHITLSYTKDVPPDRLEDVLEELRETFATYDPIDVTLVGKPVHYFDNGDERIAYAQAEFLESQALFDDLAEALASFGYSVSKHGEFKPHVTLAYLPADAHYSGPSPDGSWSADAVDVWYGGELVEAMPLAGRLVVDTTRDKGPLIKEGYIWRTQKDTKVRSSHARLEGKRFKLNTGDSKEGQPGDAPNCRCAKQFIVPARGTKRARAASERTVRRALRQNYERVTGKALKRKAAAK